MINTKVGTGVDIGVAIGVEISLGVVRCGYNLCDTMSSTGTRTGPSSPTTAGSLNALLDAAAKAQPKAFTSGRWVEKGSRVDLNEGSRT